MLPNSSVDCVQVIWAVEKYTWSANRKRHVPCQCYSDAEVLREVSAFGPLSLWCGSKGAYMTSDFV